MSTMYKNFSSGILKKSCRLVLSHISSFIFFFFLEGGTFFETGSYNLAQADLEFVILLPQPSKGTTMPSHIFL
jgi:hypothetical protein